MENIPYSPTCRRNLKNYIKKDLSTNKWLSSKEWECSFLFSYKTLKSNLFFLISHNFILKVNPLTCLFSTEVQRTATKMAWDRWEDTQTFTSILEYICICLRCNKVEGVTCISWLIGRYKLRTCIRSLLSTVKFLRWNFCEYSQHSLAVNYFRKHFIIDVRQGSICVELV